MIDGCRARTATVKGGMLGHKHVRTLLLASVFALTSCATAGDEGATYADVDLVDISTSALVINGSSIQSINGSYTGCKAHTGNWSLAVTGSPALDYETLSVTKGDTACALALTDIRTTSDGRLTASSALPLGTSYGTGRSFGSPVKYYANAMLSAVTFTNDFTLTLLFSGDPEVASGSNTATFEAVSSTASASGPTAPNYTLDVSAVSITTDFSKIAQSIGGNLSLAAGSTTGDYYVIVVGSVADTYAAIDAAYTGGSTVTMASSIAATAFLASSVNLTTAAVRTLIISKALNGVRAYQKFAITFNPPV